MMTPTRISPFLIVAALPLVVAFTIPAISSTPSRLHSSNNDLLTPDYEIEKLPFRIGHGFDIHRMAPIQDAGQPIVIGGVVIDHLDQKVCGYLGGLCFRDYQYFYFLAEPLFLLSPVD